MTVGSTIAEESVRRAGTARSALDLQRRNCAEVSGPTILLYFLCGCLSCFLCGCLFVIFPLWLFVMFVAVCHISFGAVCHVSVVAVHLSCFLCGCLLVMFPSLLFVCHVSFVAVCLSCFLCGCLFVMFPLWLFKFCRRWWHNMRMMDRSDNNGDACCRLSALISWRLWRKI